MPAKISSVEMPTPDARAEGAARERQQQLTKPPGSLGRLEELACWFAGRLRHPLPEIVRPEIFVFAGDHGVAGRGVSAFPQSVTGQMLGNFANGGAAINVLATLHGCRIEVVDVGVAGGLKTPRGVRNERVREGTRDLFVEAAMTDEELAAALSVGERCAREAVGRGAQLVIGGDMGIANTTAAACLICAFTGAPVEQVVGRGTGVDDAGLARKVAVVEGALARVRTAVLGDAAGGGAVGIAGGAAHGTGAVGIAREVTRGSGAVGAVGEAARGGGAVGVPSDAARGSGTVGGVGEAARGGGAVAVPSDAARGSGAVGAVGEAAHGGSGGLQSGGDAANNAWQMFAHLGGLEIAAMAGLYIEAARHGVPVLLDGFISGAAALAAVALEPRAVRWMLASHRSFESGHAVALDALGLKPLIDLGMRLGEGSGAALTLPIIHAALALHRKMATFAEAGVAGAVDGAT